MCAYTVGVINTDTDFHIKEWTGLSIQKCNQCFGNCELLILRAAKPDLAKSSKTKSQLSAQTMIL